MNEFDFDLDHLDFDTAEANNAVQLALADQAAAAAAAARRHPFTASRGTRRHTLPDRQKQRRGGNPDQRDPARRSRTAGRNRAYAQRG